MMRTLPVALMSAIAAACATSGQEPDLTPVQTPISITTEEGASTTNVRVTQDRYVSDHVLIGERLELWRLLPDAYESLGLPLPAVNARDFSAFIQNHVITRSLKGERLSNFLVCGSGILGAHADTHRIRLSVRTWIEPADSAGRSVVKSSVAASAQDPMHGTAGSTHCSSLGRLEMGLREELRRLSVQKRLERIRGS